ncbi:MAG: DedA family protein [Epsilonproteobacteria bacterium]|nr:MAG: DedA family protein [Campylobacterota bacterium]
MLAEMAQWLVDIIFDMGYWGIFLLMGIESSFIPFPSEIILIPAGYLASKGDMNFSLVFLVSLGGSMLGALINYYGALWIGRNVLEKYGKYFFIKPAALHKMDDFFAAHGPISTFTGRLIPGIRQLISIPAGLTRMKMNLFLLYTALGAGIWSLILIVLGYTIGENEALIKEYLHQITFIVVITVFFMIALYIYLHKKKTRRTKV